MELADFSSVLRDVVKGTCRIKYICGRIIRGFHTVDRSVTATDIFIGFV